MAFDRVENTFHRFVITSTHDSSFSYYLTKDGFWNSILDNAKWFRSEHKARSFVAKIRPKYTDENFIIKVIILTGGEV